MRRYLGGLLTGIIIMAAVPVFAATSAQVSAFLRGINIEFGSQHAAMNVLVYDNHTYLPLREAGAVFGLEARWDSATETVIFTEKGLDTKTAEALTASMAAETKAVEPPRAEAEGTRLTFALGEKVTFSDGTVITVTEVREASEYTESDENPRAETISTFRVMEGKKGIVVELTILTDKQPQNGRTYVSPGQFVAALVGDGGTIYTKNPFSYFSAKNKLLPGKECCVELFYPDFTGKECVASIILTSGDENLIVSLPSLE